MTIAVEGVSVVAIDGTPVVQTPGLCKKMKQLRWSLVLVFMVGFIATTPSSVIPQLQQDAYGNNSYVVAGAFSSAKGAALVVYAPIVGSVSDRVGRKATLTAVLALSAVPYLAYAVTQNFWIYSYVNCFLGLFDVALSLLMSTIADTDRSRNVAITANDRTNGMTESFALGSSLLFLGLSLSPFLGAFLSNEITFIVCSVMQVSIVFIAWFLYPRQDLPDAAEAIVVAPKEIKVLDKQKASLTRIFEAFRRFPQLRVIITVVALNAVAEQLLDKFLMLYLSMTLNFDTTNIAVVIAVLGLGGVFGMLFTVRALVKKWGNLGALRIALAFNVVICALYAFLPYAYPIFAITALSVVGMAVYPCACALAMRCTKEYDAGTAQGVTQGARMIASAVTPFAFGYFFDATENFEFPGIPFMAGGAFVFFSLCMTKFVDLEIIDGTVVQTETGVGSPLLNDNGTTAVRVADSTYDAPATDKAQI